MNILERYSKPTPRFFRILRNIGIALATAGGAVIAAPIALPATLVAVATYLTVAGTVATAISQAVIADDTSDAGSKDLREELNNQLAKEKEETARKQFLEDHTY
jgi:hypothetical protein